MHVHGGNVDVSIQDQTSDIVDYYVCRTIVSLTLSSTLTVGGYTVAVVSGVGVANGTYLCIQEGSRAFQAQVLSGGGTTTLTIDTPIDYAFTTAATIVNRNPNLNVDGSTTPVEGILGPLPGTKWHITGFHIVMGFPTQAGDDSKFGNLAALTKGVVFRKRNGINHTLFNAKTNGHIRERSGAGNLVYTSASPAGAYGVSASYDMLNERGAVIELDGDNDDKLSVLIQDNVTSLSYFRVVAHGHIVVD